MMRVLVAAIFIVAAQQFLAAPASNQVTGTKGPPRAAAGSGTCVPGQCPDTPSCTPSPPPPPGP